MFRKMVSLLVPVLAVMFLAACGGAKKDGEKAGESEKISFSTAVAAVREVPGSFQANGAFVAEDTSDIAPAVGGRVAATPVEVGSFVTQGQVICQLERKDAELRIDQSRAALEQAKFLLSQAQSRVGLSGGAAFNPESVPEVSSSKAAFDASLASAKLAAADARRYENLVRSGDVSQSAFEKARTQQETAEAAAESARKQYEAQVNAAKQSFGAVEAARAALTAAESQLAQAQKGLEDTSVRAPFDGYITDRPAAVGQWLGTSSKVATIVRIATVKLQLQIPEQQAGMAKTGMAVTARVAAWPERDFVGKLIAVVPFVSANSRTFMAEARFDNPKAELRPGMYAAAKVMLDGMEKAVFVPSKALFYDSTTDAYNVYSVEDDVARLNVVQRGDTAGDEVRILSGLQGGEKIVLDNHADLYDGAIVELN